MNQRTNKLTLASCRAIAVGLFATRAPSQYSPPSHCTGVKNVGAAVVARTAVKLLARNVPGYLDGWPRG